MANKKRISINEFLENLFRDNPSLSIDELTDRVELYSGKPDIKKLLRQHYRNITNQLIRKMRNKDGKRRVYADKELDVYVDIEQETDIDKLKRIRKSLSHHAKGNQTACKLVTKRLAELAGQTVLQFEFDNPITVTGE